MQIKSADYILTAVRPDQYPVHDRPEIALVGRSNVGKSSIINGLVNRKNLARVAATPGKTREINFYKVNNTLYLVDLPGYGYAKVSKTAKESWAEMIETYLNTRPHLRLTLMLVDIRHNPTADDQTMYQWLAGQDKPRLLVASKLDKIPVSQVGQRLQEIRAVLGMDSAESLIPFSAVTKQGRNEIWAQIESYLG
ncbi:MAG TPA: ribosome biogenesis GTP-binding protein YihA/YsxC [Bacillota bacterium]|nr:ribosome biogenesis GTP-binding protein YihA/YsxC [Bacillota bacterium]